MEWVALFLYVIGVLGTGTVLNALDWNHETLKNWGLAVIWPFLFILWLFMMGWYLITDR